MAAIKEPAKAKLFCAIMYGEEANLQKAEKELSRKFGPIERESPEYDFSFTSYYQDEMGEALKKRFISFKKSIDREKLREIRLFTQKIEEKYSDNGKRLVNIDPGYITKDALFIATLKDRSHKVYIGKGVFVDMNLIFKKDGFFDFPWTFADYKLPSNQKFFHEVRNDLLKGSD